MDPFNEVQDDAWNTLATLQSLIGRRKSSKDSGGLASDFDNNWQELEEIYTDLELAVQMSAKNPDRFQLTEHDIVNRQKILLDLGQRMEVAKQDWHHADTNRLSPQEVTLMSNRLSYDDDNPFSDANATEGHSWQEQQMLQEQDLQLDLIHQTMHNLNQQAQLMGSELESQGFMLDDLDRDMDTMDSKMQRGMKRINRFIEKNKELASNWCIGILIVVLVVLLVLVVVA